jgi:hypothetical protein
MGTVIESEPALDRSIKAFLELGQLRNRLAHHNFAAFVLEKTADEIFDLYTEASIFIDRVGDELRTCSKNSRREEAADKVPTRQS